MTIFACDPVNSPKSKFCHFYVLMHSIGNGSVGSTGDFHSLLYTRTCVENLSRKKKRMLYWAGDGN